MWLWTLRKSMAALSESGVALAVCSCCCCPPLSSRCRFLFAAAVLWSAIYLALPSYFESSWIPCTLLSVSQIDGIAPSPQTCLSVCSLNCIHFVCRAVSCRCIHCKDATFPPCNPRPILSILDYSPPLCELTTEKAQLEVRHPGIVSVVVEGRLLPWVYRSFALLSVLQSWEKAILPTFLRIEESSTSIRVACRFYHHSCTVSHILTGPWYCGSPAVRREIAVEFLAQRYLQGIHV